jgi:hypothetical protein
MTQVDLQTLAAQVAFRQLRRHGVPGDELSAHETAIVHIIQESQARVDRAAEAERSVLLQSGGDDQEFEKISLLALYAELGCSVADLILKKRRAEAN